MVVFYLRVYVHMRVKVFDGKKYLRRNVLVSTRFQTSKFVAGHRRLKIECANSSRWLGREDANQQIRGLTINK